MRLGRIEFNMGYVVDLDNKDMVWHAKDAIADDVMSVVQGGNIPLDTITEGKFVEGDIPDFLLDDEDGDEYNS